MKLYRLEREQRLPIDSQTAWNFFSDPNNLSKITPPDLNLHPVSPLPDEMYPGMIISYKIKPFPGVSSLWVTEITRVEKPRFFVDEQRFGPYKFWHHQHHFEETGKGLLCRDLIHYMLPFDPFSRIIHNRFVLPQLDAIFTHRNLTLDKLFRADDVVTDKT